MTRRAWTAIVIALVLLPYGIAASETGRVTRFAYVGDRHAGGKSPCLKRRVAPTDWGIAHRTLPCGAWVRVTNRRTGLSVVAPVINRGPYGACLDPGWRRGPCRHWAVKRRASDPGMWRGVADLTPLVFAALAARSFDTVTLENLCRR